MRLKCPICKKKVAWKDNPFRPFCSDRCRMTDLGKWASDAYRIKWKEIEMPSEVLLIGIGPKGRYSLTEETLKLLKTSQIIIGGKKLLSQFKDFTAKTIILPSDLSKVLEILKENPDGIAAILALGNENLYGLSRFLYQRFDKNSLRII